MSVIPLLDKWINLNISNLHAERPFQGKQHALAFDFDNKTHAPQNKNWLYDGASQKNLRPTNILSNQAKGPNWRGQQRFPARLCPSNLFREATKWTLQLISGWRLFCFVRSNMASKNCYASTKYILLVRIKVKYDEMISWNESDC